MFDNMQVGNYVFDSDVAIEWGEKLLMAAAIIIVTWILAKLAKWAFAKLIDRVSFFQRATGSGETVGESLGKIVGLLIWLFGLLAVLQVFALNGVITPVQTLLNNVMDVIPNLLWASIIFFVGVIVARIVRDIVVTAMTTVNFDKWANRGGVDQVTGNTTISKTIGTIVYVLIIIPIAILALDALELEAVSGPASDMLQMVFIAVPKIIIACILLGLGFFIARWVGGLIEELLPDLGADRAIASIGLLPATTSASSIIAKIVMIAIMIFFAIAATEFVGFTQLTNILNTILAQAGSVVFGVVLIAVGVMIARVIKNLVEGANGPGMVTSAVYYIAIGLFIFIGIKQMEIGGNIVDYAFIALMAASAIAFAIAFGIGGRDAAARQLKKMQDAADADAPAARKPAKQAASPSAKAAKKNSPPKG